jgi:hypothetical protein
MTNAVLLNNIDHKDLRIVTTRGAEFGDDVMTAFTFPEEFRNIQACYPIVFHKSADDAAFHPFALLGFKEGQNLFLGRDGWDAPYVPLTVERQPFLIGFADGEMVIHVDLDSPRISATEGEAVFLPHGGTTEFLDRANSRLLAIYEGMGRTSEFIAAMVDNDLLESFVLDVELDDGSQNRLIGFYTINEERLGALSGEVLERLSKAGHLQAAYMAIASLSNLRNLIDRQNRLNAGAV